MAIVRPKLKFIRGKTYVIDQSDASNAGHPLKFTADSGTSEYTTGVTATGTPGQAGANITFVVPNNAPENMMYYCTTHGVGMGQKIKIITDPSINTWFGDRAVFNQMDYADASPTYQAFSYASISTPGNAVGFANSVKGRDPNNGNMSNGTRGVFTEGDQGEDILYLTIPTLSSVSDFGNLSAQNTINSYASHWGGASASNGIRGFIVGDADTNTNADGMKGIFYITIDTPGNAVNFGIDFAIHTGRGAAVSDDTYIVAGGGIVPSGLGDVAAGSSDEVKGLGYFTAMTASSSTSFGDLAIARPYLAGCSNKTRGVFIGGEGNNLGGSPNSDYMIEDIETITVTTPGNSTQFGDLRRKRAKFGVTCNGTHGVTAGGQYQPGAVHVFSDSYEIDYFSMETAGTATDFGDVYGNNANYWSAGSGNAS